MKNPDSPIRLAHFFVFLLLCYFVAQAQTRTFVSGLGSDANPCTRVSPCRSFQRAHDVVDFGGEVIAVDSAGYGPIAITKSVSIIGDGVYAGINTSSGVGLTIATSGIAVNLRSLTIDGLGSAQFAIHATDFQTLHIENCIVNGFAQSGIIIDHSAAGTKKVFIKDSVLRNNGGSGIGFNNVGGTELIAIMEGTRVESNNNWGIVSHGTGTRVTVRGCLSSGNSFNGFQSQDGAVMNIESSVASNNVLHGISSMSGTVRVSNSTVTNNALFGFVNNSGNFESRGNNTVAGNNSGGAQTSGTITPITPL